MHTSIDPQERARKSEKDKGAPSLPRFARLAQRLVIQNESWKGGRLARLASLGSLAAWNRKEFESHKGAFERRLEAIAAPKQTKQE